jgi:hypothetical protein
VVRVVGKVLVVDKCFEVGEVVEGDMMWVVAVVVVGKKKWVVEGTSWLDSSEREQMRLYIADRTAVAAVAAVETGSDFDSDTRTSPAVAAIDLV